MGKNQLTRADLKKSSYRELGMTINYAKEYGLTEHDKETVLREMRSRPSYKRELAKARKLRDEAIARDNRREASLHPPRVPSRPTRRHYGGGGGVPFMPNLNFGSGGEGMPSLSGFGGMPSSDFGGIPRPDFGSRRSRGQSYIDIGREFF